MTIFVPLFWKLLLDCTWRHGGHVGAQHSPLASLVCTSNMAAAPLYFKSPGIDCNPVTDVMGNFHKCRHTQSITTICCFLPTNEAEGCACVCAFYANVFYIKNHSWFWSYTPMTLNNGFKTRLSCQKYKKCDRNWPDSLDLKPLFRVIGV